MRFDEALGAGVKFADPRGGPLLVPPHHAAETGHVDHDDGRELAARYGGFRGHAETIMTLLPDSSTSDPLRVAIRLAPTRHEPLVERDGVALALTENIGGHRLGGDGWSATAQGRTSARQGSARDGGDHAERLRRDGLHA